MASSVFSFRMKSVRLSPVSSLNFRERYGRLRNNSSAIFSAVIGLLDVVRHIHGELRGMLAQMQPLHPRRVVQNHPILQVHDLLR